MDQTVAYAKLPFQIELLKAKEEVKLQMSKEKLHFNSAHYTGEWTAISLRSPGGTVNNIIPDSIGEQAFDDTDLMRDCPSIKNLVDSFQCPVMSVRLLNLKKGALIKEHRDAELYFEKGEARLHIPIFTNNQVEFYVEGKQVVMGEGDCWYINANLPHRVSNNGETDRIHLVMDCKVNEWLKEAFNAAEVTALKNEDRTNELKKIIGELRVQNTATSIALANQLELQLPEKAEIPGKKILQNWLPYKLTCNGTEPLLQWLYAGSTPFTDPFFNETISKCRRLAENSTPYKAVSGLAMVAEWVASVESIEPTAFIFHVSRCGSTLVSQLLGMDDETVSLSEVPVFDEILQLPLKHGADNKTTNEVLSAAIKFYGAKRTGKEKRLFIKTDSWHLLFYTQLRFLFPSTPFIIIYRNPSEVLFSQQRLKGMHAIRGLIDASLFNFTEEQLNKFDHQDYMSLVLEKYFTSIIQIANTDKNILLVNYNEGISSMMEKIARFVIMELKEADYKLFFERSRYHAKNNNEIFAEKYPASPVTSPNIGILKELYEKIEKLKRAF